MTSPIPAGWAKCGTCGAAYASHHECPSAPRSTSAPKITATVSANVTSGVPARGLDPADAAFRACAEELQRIYDERIGGTGTFVGVLATFIWPEIHRLAGERDRARDLAAHLEAELAGATGEVSRLSEENERLRGWSIAGHEAGVDYANRLANAEAALAAERERVARLTEALRNVDRAIRGVARSYWNSGDQKIVKIVRDALSGDTGGESQDA